MGVPGYTPVLVKHLGFVFVKKIKDLDERDLTGLQTWTHAGWKPIIGLEKSFGFPQTLLEIKTNNGSLVHVTDDACYEILHSFPSINKMNYIRKIRKGLSGKMKAQEEFIRRGNFEPGKITCHVRTLDDTTESVVYNLKTTVGTYQAGVGNIIVTSS